jgi:regulator of sigma E protease
VQLAIFNIIPFPALDGGWIMLLLLQIITRKEFNKEKVATINYYGFMILMALMVIVLIKDIVSPVQF